MKEEALSMDHVTTDDFEMTNLDNMTMRIFKGEIAGLLPINEQGRKKLLEIMQYNVPIHYGRVYINGTIVNSYLKSDLSANRVSVISGKNRMVQDLSVSDNLFVLRRGFRQFLLDQRLLNRQTELLLKQAGLQIEPNTLAGHLGEFERVVVEVIRAVMQRAVLIIFDEISSVLSMQDILRLRDLIRIYTKQGVSFLYIANHHEEVIPVSDRTMIMKNGRIIKNVCDQAIGDAEVLQIAGAEGYPELYVQLKHMIPAERYAQYLEQKPKAALEFCDVSSNFLNHLSFSVQPGECVVLLDRSMAAVEDAVRVLTGNETDWSGKIICGDRTLNSKKGIHLLDDDIAVIQEHAHKSMIFPHLTFMENLCIMADRKISSIFLQKKMRKSIRREFAGVFGPELDAVDMNTVSKEKKYKLVYYRYYMLRPKVVFCVQPFSGADMYLRRRILELIQKLKQRGIAVVILTVGLADSYFVADRLLMMEKGSILCEFQQEDFQYLWDDLIQSQ